MPKCYNLTRCVTQSTKIVVAYFGIVNRYLSNVYKHILFPHVLTFFNFFYFCDLNVYYICCILLCSLVGKLSDNNFVLVLSTGVHVFGNSVTAEPWRKVVRGRETFAQIVSRQHYICVSEELKMELMSFLSDTTRCLLLN